MDRRSEWAAYSSSRLVLPTLGLCFGLNQEMRRRYADTQDTDTQAEEGCDAVRGARPGYNWTRDWRESGRRQSARKTLVPGLIGKAMRKEVSTDERDKWKRAQAERV